MGQTPLKRWQTCGIRLGICEKMNENNEVVRYKARLVAQDFSYIPSINFEETFSNGGCNYITIF